MEPAVRPSIPISPRIVETRIKQKSKAPTPQSKTALPLSGEPTLPTFKKVKKGILGNPTQGNRFTDNQMPTPIKPVGGLVPEGKERNFRMRPQRKRPHRQQHGRKGKCPTKAQPVTFSFHQPDIRSSDIPNLKVGPRSLCAPDRPNSGGGGGQEMRHPPKSR